MSQLRQTILEWLRYAGNASGCHQMAERSFFFHGKQFPVCARCTGVSIGQLLALILGFFWRVPVALSTAFLTAMGIDWGLQTAGIKESTNIRRLFTGILGGFGLFSIYLSIFRKLWRFMVLSFSRLQ